MTFQLTPKGQYNDNNLQEIRCNFEIEPFLQFRHILKNKDKNKNTKWDCLDPQEQFSKYMLQQTVRNYG